MPAIALSMRGLFFCLLFFCLSASSSFLLAVLLVHPCRWKLLAPLSPPDPFSFFGSPIVLHFRPEMTGAPAHWSCPARPVSDSTRAQLDNKNSVSCWIANCRQWTCLPVGERIQPRMALSPIQRVAVAARRNRSAERV